MKETFREEKQKEVERERVGLLNVCVHEKANPEIMMKIGLSSEFVQDTIL